MLEVWLIAPQEIWILSENLLIFVAIEILPIFYHIGKLFWVVAKFQALPEQVTIFLELKYLEHRWFDKISLKKVNITL